MNAALNAAAPRILVVVAAFYQDLADEMVAGARAVLTERGAAVDVVQVPGALEIPLAVSFATAKGAFDGVVALGCVIRGETSHYDIVCNESARGLYRIALERDLPVGNGILTVEDFDQAWERANRDRLDKGGDAAKAVLELVALKRRFGG